jgi:uncharacterized protein (TIGR03086 family)
VDLDLIGWFDQATAWTASKIATADGRREAATPCDAWNVGRLLDHLLDGQALFAAGAAGAVVAPPLGEPPHLVGNDPAAQYEEARQATIARYSRPGALTGTVNTPFGPMPAAQFLGIAVCDQLIHGWDLARGTNQDSTMPADLAAAAWQMLNGRISDANRGLGKNFKSAIPVPEAAGFQDRLLGYTGRQP